MEAATNSNQIILKNVLPFMSVKFFDQFSESFQNIKLIDVKINLLHNIPSKIKHILFLDSVILVFLDKTSKDNFINIYSNTCFPGTNLKIEIQDDADLTPVKSEDNSLKEIKFVIPYNNLVHTVYERTMNQAGLIYKDKNIIEKQTKAISFLIKSMGTNLIKGKSIMSVSLPVNIFDKRTLLHVLAYEMSLNPIFLSRAAITTDPIERLKWATVLLVSQLHLSPLQTKPFTPILGETFQCTIGDLNIYLEQTESKPITMSFLAIQTEGLYKIYGNITTNAATGANTVKARKVGKYIIEYKDGLIHEIYFPQVHIKGTTMGKRLFSFKHVSLVIDRQNNLASYVKYNPDEKGFFSSMFSKKQKSYPDTFK